MYGCAGRSCDVQESNLPPRNLLGASSMSPSSSARTNSDDPRLLEHRNRALEVDGYTAKLQALPLSHVTSTNLEGHQKQSAIASGASGLDQNLSAQIQQLVDSFNKLQTRQIELDSRVQACEFVAKQASLSLDAAATRLSHFDAKFNKFFELIEALNHRVKSCEDSSQIATDLVNRQQQPKYDGQRVALDGGLLPPRCSPEIEEPSVLTNSGLKEESVQECLRHIEEELQSVKFQQKLQMSHPTQAVDFVRKISYNEKIDNIEQSIESIKVQQGLAEKLGGDIWGDTSKSPHENGLHYLDAAVLDKAQMYELSDSIWDMALFIGLPSFGCGVSLIIMLIHVLNVTLQLWFCQIIYSHMLDSPIYPEFLDDLLLFRVGVAHNVDYADKLQMRSMATKICVGDETLHLSGRQFDMRIDMAEFYDAAMSLCILTVACWIIKMLGEAREAYQFFNAVWSIRRGQTTKVMTDLEGIRLGRSESKDLQQENAEIAATLIKLRVTIQVVTMSFTRALGATLLIAIPRLVLAAVLGVIGVQYLSITSRMEDLILNGMALAFINDIDEIIHQLFTPHRANTLLKNLDPLPVRSHFEKLHGVAWLTAILRILFVGGMCTLLTFAFTVPFFDQLKQATDILCSGDTDFVVTKNKATGVVHAAKSQGNSSWSVGDSAVLQLARPTLSTWAGWSVNQSILDVAFGTVPLAVIETEGTLSYGESAPISTLPMSVSKFDFVASLSGYTLEESSAYGACANMKTAQSDEAAAWQLREILVNASAIDCDRDSDTIIPLCNSMNMTRLRAICPLVCGCDRVLPIYAGFFAHPSWGCPTTCTSSRKANEGYDFDVRGIRRPCEDTPEPVFFLDAYLAGSVASGISDNMWIWYKNYIDGLFEYVYARPGFVESVKRNVPTLVTLGFFPTGTVTSDVIEYIINGSMQKLLLQGHKWEFYPGAVMWRNNVPVQGCDFLTSPELTFLLGVELCDDADFWSLRTVCPKACGCGAMEGCPMQCSRDIVQLPCVDMWQGRFYEETVAELQWTLGGTPGAQHYHCQMEGTLEEVQALCGKWNGSAMRKICPIACSCHEPLNSITGFFSSTSFGCPQACADMRTATNELASKDVRTCEDAPDMSLLNSTYALGTFRKWLEGFINWFTRRPLVTFEMEKNLELLANPSVFNPPVIDISRKQEYKDFILTGQWGDFVFQGSWYIFPGVPHPRGLQGCEFFTSYEIAILYALDFCSTGQFTSLRFVCPVSCNCGPGMSECPHPCHADRRLLGS